MEILETIPVFKDYWWVIALTLLGGSLTFAILAVCVFEGGGFDGYSIAALIFGTMLTIVGIFCITTDYVKWHSHDEYVVRLSDSYSANEFNQTYEVVKVFEYSDVIRVKERKKD